MFIAEQGKLMNYECAVAFNSVLQNVNRSNPDLHARFVMSNCKIALHYLQCIHMLGIDGYSPMAVSLCRTYYEIVCATMYLAENKNELDDFLRFGRLMLYETGEEQNLKGKTLIVVGVALWLINPLYSHGLQHQDDSERRRCSGRWNLGIADSGIVGTHAQLPALGWFCPDAPSSRR